MIQKLKDGKCRLYSRKKDEKTGKRRKLGTFENRKRQGSTSAKCSISSGIEGVVGGIRPPEGATPTFGYGTPRGLSYEVSLLFT